MALQTHSFFGFVFSMVVVGSSFGLQYLVGDSVWSIPPYPNFYNDWSSSHHLLTSDSLVFDFESELYNLMQVTTLDYKNCRATNPIKVLTHAPATILLDEPGAFYYLCNLSNYCDLGQKISVIVHDKNSPRTQIPAPVSSPSSLPLTPEPSPADWNASHSPMPADSSSEAPSATIDVGHTKSSGTTFSRLCNLGLLTELFFFRCFFGVLIGP